MTDPRPRKRRRLAAAIFVPLGVATATLWLAWPRSMRLMDRATRVTPSSLAVGDFSTYAWAKDGSLVVCNAAKSSDATQVVRIRPGVPAAVPIATVDTSLGRGPLWATPSAGGRWLATAPLSNPAAKLSVLDLDTGESRLMDSRISPYTLWLPIDFVLLWTSDDSKCACYDESSGTLAVEDLLTGHVEISSVPKHLPARMAYTSDGRLITCDFLEHLEDNNAITITEVTPGPPLVVKRHTFQPPPHGRITLPIGWRYTGGAVSPNGDRIACEVSVQRKSPYPGFMQRMLAHVGVRPPGPGVELWVCGVDGSNMHEIGAIPVDLNNPNPRLTRLTDLLPLSVHWTPDGKRVGFVYKGAIWT